MKNLFSIIAVIAILIGGYWLGTKFSKPTYPEGTTLVSTAMLDSLKNLKPEIVVKDSVVWRDTTIYKTTPSPIPETPEINMYSDSIINDSTWLVINDRIKGLLLSRTVENRSPIRYTKIREPYPVLVDNPIYLTQKQKTQYWSKLNMIGNKNTFLSGVEVGIVTKQNTIIGIGGLTDFEESYISATIGIIF